MWIHGPCLIMRRLLLHTVSLRKFLRWTTTFILHWTTVSIQLHRKCSSNSKNHWSRCKRRRRWTECQWVELIERIGIRLIEFGGIRLIGIELVKLIRIGIELINVCLERYPRRKRVGTGKGNKSGLVWTWTWGKEAWRWKRVARCTSTRMLS